MKALVIATTMVAISAIIFYPTDTEESRQDRNASFRIGHTQASLSFKSFMSDFMPHKACTKIVTNK